MCFLQVKDLKVYYPIRGGFFHQVIEEVRAVDGIHMEIEKGMSYGLVGESGCGKSTTGKAIMGLEKVTAGQMLFEGKPLMGNHRRTSKYAKDIQMIFQDANASLNPKKRILDIVAEPIRNFMRFSQKEENRKVIELLEIVGMTEDVKDKYPHEFSGGQKQRIGIARALACHPKLIIADEPVSALDLSVQAQVLNFMKDIQREFGLSYLFISHDLGVVKHMCDHLSIMYKGRIVESGTCKDIFKDARHIYTKRLLSAIPEIDPRQREKSKKHRQEIERYYKENEHAFYDETGRVYDLIAMTPTHFVARKGG